MANAAQLRQEAEHCQRLAAGVSAPDLARTLLTMARRYLERAAELDSVAPLAQQHLRSKKIQECSATAIGRVEADRSWLQSWIRNGDHRV
jgi:hypothetical protein